MIQLREWAARWGVPADAVAELSMIMNYQPLTGPTNLTTEEGVQKYIRLSEAKKGNVLWRNNVGAMQDDNGRVIRYGLANDSRKMNQYIKSSDLVGIRKVCITQDMVGQIIGQFYAIECKRPGWEYKGTEREEAQSRFLTLVTTNGGYAKFSTGEDNE